ncbi:uncharacterized protein LOC112601871 [Melanaphis sacchari]|uniref:uncharacterized protein LOC112601871 n=1 Tax=Melanaphis sacchari TaxID=742174 RepID=UPI000DC1474C|nr:uncharacterized protein LOC112601871 [Melanaphis sacchari]XP_025205512.1 uncharacterized protein LOC112601871 [Melanaphis sacchari]
MGTSEVLEEFPPPTVPDDGCPRRREQQPQDQNHQREDENDIHDDENVLTIEQARAVIKQLRDRCRFQTHQTLLWRRKAKIQEERLTQMSSEYGFRLESLTSDLLLFESRLSRKQRAISELLDQREAIIERQQHAIRCLHSRLADFGVTASVPGCCGGDGDRVGGGGPTSDDGNVDDSDSAVIMEEDESGNSQEDASEQSSHPRMDRRRTSVVSASASEGSADGRLPAEDGRETNVRGTENETATTYNRVMSNHRSVTKPKDVKYKRINKAKSKSLEELRGRLKNWVDRGQRMSLTVDPTYG